MVRGSLHGCPTLARIAMAFATDNGQLTTDKGAQRLVIELPWKFERSARQTPHEGASGERMVIGQ
jgi:hypothetical protein